MSLLKLSSLSQSDRQNDSMSRRFARWLRWQLPTQIKSHRILSGQLKGMRIVTSWRDYPAAIIGITEPELLAWFTQEATSGETWIDIGAHYGYTALALSRAVGPSGRVFAFEPMAATAGCLARTRLTNGLESLIVVPIALGAEPDFRLQRLTTVRGMLDSTIDSKNAPAGDQWHEVLLVSGLDWLWPRLNNGDHRIHGIKIDVQGMEFEVLQGMQQVLEKQHPKLAVEFHRGVPREPILAFLERCGYSRHARPIEQLPGETSAQFLDDRSYAFTAH